MSSNAKVYEEVFAEVVAAMEAGVTPWVRPWSAQPSTGPRNAATGRAYSGGNVFVLTLRAMRHGYTTDGWVTFQQALAAKAPVKKGETSTPVYFMSSFVPRPKAGEPQPAEGEAHPTRPIFMARLFRVFNLDQLTEGPGLDRLRAKMEVPVLEPAARDAAAEATIAATGARITHGGDRAFYAPVVDAITMPIPEAFTEPAAYYGTLFHELGHWSGHASRLNRLTPTQFGAPEYAFEELVAELCACFLSTRHQMPAVSQSAAYLANWAKACRAEPNLLARAASLAQRAADFIAPASAPAEVAAEV